MEKAQEARAENDKGAMKDSASLLATNFIQEYYDKVYVQNDSAFRNYANAGAYAKAQFPSATAGGYTYAVSGDTLTVTDSKGNSVVATIGDNGNISWNDGTSSDDIVEPNPVQYGLLDDEGNLVASWDSLVNDYFLRIENDYDANDHDDETGNSMSYVLNSNSELSEGTQLVIPSSYTVTTAKKINGQKIASLDSKEYVSDITAVAANTQNSITKIGYNAIANCDKLTSITLPNSVTSIGENAFTGCSKLESIKIPNGVTSISNNAFSYCDMLASVTIPNGVTRIEYNAFYGCYSLTNITIPNTVTYIDSAAFSGLNSVTFKGDVEEINDSGGIYNSDGTDIYFDFDTSNCDVRKYLDYSTRYVYYNKNYGYYGEFEIGTGSDLVLDTPYSDDTYVRYKNTFYFENN